MVLENVVTEQLIQGPEDSQLMPVFVNTLKILSVHVQDGICTIDFDRAVNQRPAECTADARTVLYALVNSICDTCDDVEGVRIRIDGMSDTVFRDEIPLNQVFYMEMSEVEDYTEAADSAGVFTSVDPENLLREDEKEDAGTADDTDMVTDLDSSGDAQQVSGVSRIGSDQAEAPGSGSQTNGTGSGETVRNGGGAAEQQDDQSIKPADGTSPADMQSEDGSAAQEVDPAGSDDSSEQKKETDTVTGNSSFSGNKSSGGMVGVDPALSGE